MTSDHPQLFAAALVSRTFMHFTFSHGKNL
jgi:hypothetical protein